MIGKLYTADEIFNAIKLATDKAINEIFEDYDVPEWKREPGAHAITVVGANIAYSVAEILGFDMEQLEDYCERRLEEEDGE